MLWSQIRRKTNRRGPTRNNRLRARLYFELLEDRRVLSALGLQEAFDNPTPESVDGVGSSAATTASNVPGGTAVDDKASGDESHVHRYTILNDDLASVEDALADIGVKRIKNYKHFSGLAVNLTESQADSLRAVLGDDLKLIKDEPFSAFDDAEVSKGKPGGGGDTSGGGVGGPGSGDQQVPWGITAINADDAHAITKGAGVVVCVLDTGLDQDHPDLAANIAGGANYIDGGSWDDDNGHGTHVAGTIAALDNSVGVLGVAPETTLLAAKAFNQRGVGNMGDIADAVLGCLDLKAQYAPNMPMVVNMSFALRPWDEADALFRPAMLTVYASGAILVAAAGNDLPGQGVLKRPAAYPEVLAVTAIQEDLSFWDQSNNGGGYLSSIPFGNPYKFPEFAAPGADVFSLWKKGGTKILSGTSMSTAHVSGVVALGLSVNSLGPVGVDIGLTPDQAIGGLIDAELTVLNVESGNVAPLAVDDTSTTDEDTAIIIDVLSNDSDDDGDPLSVDSVTQGSNGSVAINPDNTLTYTPDANFNGTDSFTYQASDGTATSNVAMVSVTINPVNDVPAAVDDAESTTEGVPVTTNVLTNDTLGDEPTAITGTTDGANGTVSFDAASGTTMYTPNAGFNGIDQYTYTIRDNDGETSTAVVTVTVSLAPTSFTVIQDEDPDLTIPDQGIAFSTLVVANSFTIANLILTVDITHSRPGDLTVYLSHGGTTVELSSITGGNILAFNGDDVSGDWTLEVHDSRKMKTGTLNDWRITVESAP